MVFENSNWENRLNTFWNTEVVNQYERLTAFIQNHSASPYTHLFQTDYQQIQESVEKYCQNVLNVLNNFNRIKEQYEDKEYLRTYLLETKTTSVNDLLLFKEQILSFGNSRSKSSVIDIIDKTLEKLSNLFDETDQFYYEFCM